MASRIGEGGAPVQGDVVVDDQDPVGGDDLPDLARAVRELLDHSVQRLVHLGNLVFGVGGDDRRDPRTPADPCSNC
jgi:hypothetical protein